MPRPARHPLRWSMAVGGGSGTGSAATDFPVAAEGVRSLRSCIRPAVPASL